MANLISYPYPASYVPVKQNGKHLIDKEFFKYKLIKNNKDVKKKYFSCVQKKTLQCLASAVVNTETDMILKVTNSHNHDSGTVHILIVI